MKLTITIDNVDAVIQSPEMAAVVANVRRYIDAGTTSGRLLDLFHPVGSWKVEDPNAPKEVQA